MSDFVTDVTAWVKANPNHTTEEYIAWVKEHYPEHDPYGARTLPPSKPRTTFEKGKSLWVKYRVFIVSLILGSLMYWLIS